MARPDDKSTSLNIILILLLILYNVTGGFLPDPNIPGSFYVQLSIAYATGFITPCYFPYYVFNAFSLQKMRFHAYKGVILFLVIPYLIFVLLFVTSGNLDVAKNLLIIPVLYAIWVIITLTGAVKFKYQNNFKTKAAKEEVAVLFLSLTPWVGLPVIDYFNFGQAVEATTTNTGFLLLLALQLKQHIMQVKAEHQRLIDSEDQLLKWNEQLQEEVRKRTQELENLTREERLAQNCKLYSFTTREIEIVILVYKGYSHKQIAEMLFIAERTVAKHVQNIFEKAQVSNRLELSRKLDMV
ncbi:MAG: helix-turn-helix transcriptional regulator [Chitinophagaceae bacterium]|nr:helix-turn-helix transcriptional regulator [Chitinophagaceae bacterium]